MVSLDLCSKWHQTHFVARSVLEVSNSDIYETSSGVYSIDVDLPEQIAQK